MSDEGCLGRIVADMWAVSGERPRFMVGYLRIPILGKSSERRWSRTLILCGGSHGGLRQIPPVCSMQDILEGRSGLASAVFSFSKD